jgi:hypothetical protein
VKLQDSGIEQLLAHFLEGALGLVLQGSLPSTSVTHGQFEYPSCGSNSGRPVCAVWQSDRGIARICGVYDSSQSQSIRAHVLWLAWWLPSDIHHKGWWRCDQNRLNEWTKGRGHDLGGSVASGQGIAKTTFSQEQARIDK